MKLILLASLALSAVATPSGEEIFKRTTSSFCKKAKTGCTNTGEKAGVQNFCSSYLGLPPQKTKTFVDLETSTVYTTTSTTTMTSYVGSYSGGPRTQTHTETLTAADASTTIVTEDAEPSTMWVYPSQCTAGAPQGSAVAVAVRAAATQPACFSKYATQTKLSSACGCFTLTATIPATSLIESTTTISTVSIASFTTTINGPVIMTSTTTLTEVTSTTTIASGATVSAFALQDAASGNYASNLGDSAAFNTNAAGAAPFLLDSSGNLSQGSGYFADQAAGQAAGGAGSIPDFIRFETPAQFGYPMNSVTCHISRASGQCSLRCAVAVQGWAQNCVYSVPNDSRNGGWVLTPSPSVQPLSFCNYVDAPLIMPLPNQPTAVAAS